MKLAAVEEAFHGAATVGERGQIVIPASVREKMGILPGTKLLVFAHPGGLAVTFAKLQDLQAFAEGLAPFLESVAGENGDAAESELEGEDG